MPEEDRTRAPTMRLRATETDSLFALYASLQEIDRAKADLERRIKLTQNGWRDVSMIRSVLSKLIDKILETIPREKLVSLKRNMRSMRYRIYLARPVTMPPEQIIIDGEDMATLVKYAHDYSCIACDKDCNKCELGKALDHAMIQCRGRNESWSWIDCTKDYEDKDAIKI